MRSTKVKIPQLSFVCPVHNAVAWLPRTLRSFKRQTIKNYEVIVVDDGSDDGLNDLMTWYTDEDSRVKFIPSDGVRRGGAWARNTGNKTAKSDIICVTDAGDTYHPVKAEVTIKYFTKHPETDVLSHSVEVINEFGQRINLQFSIPDWDYKKQPRGISHPTVAYKKALAIKHPYREDCLHTDQYEAFLITLYLEGYNFRTVPNILLRKYDMLGLPTSRDMQAAARQKVKVYEEFSIEITPQLLNRAGMLKRKFSEVI